MDAAVSGRPLGAATLSSTAAPGRPVIGDEPWARFDDLPRNEGLRLEGFERAVVAKATDEVVPALAEAEAAAQAGNWVAGFVAYEAAAGFDATLATRPARADGLEVPLVWFGVFRRAVAERLPSREGAPRDAPWALDLEQRDHAARVTAIRSRIEAGDVYQCNLTARYRSAVGGDPFDLYRRLATAQRSAHCAYLDTGEIAVASASPELFFEWDGDTVVTRPMKGTARRGRDAHEDEVLAAGLCASAKDRAENVMIVDLLRNDLGKIAVFGSVAVPALWTLERYESVWQLTSTVTARTLPGTGLVDLFRALFPSGSVTGAPKGSAMAAISDLEDGPRGVYCGAVGLVAPPGASCRARFNVAIRTAVVDRCTGRAEYGSGGGIVWDSEPATEWAELRAKASVLSAPAGDFELLETMRALPRSGPCRWERHRARLIASAVHLGFAVRRADLDRAVSELTHELSVPSRVRLLVSRAGAITLEVEPLVEEAGEPVLLEIDDEPVDDSDQWLYHKTTRRDRYTARAARHPAADQVVLVNGRGEVTETTVANLVVRIGGRWFTPPVASGCLPGVLRGELLDHGCVDERSISVGELASADALAVVSSLRGWRPAALRS